LLRREVNWLGSYLDAHRGARFAVTWAGFVFASVATFTGVGVYALTTGPKATGNYVADRVMAVCLLGVALILNLGLAWVLGLGRRLGGFFPRLGFSALLTVGGAILVLGVVAGRALLWNALR
jgi:hypothetical protein